MAINSNSSTNISFQKINSGIIFLVIAAVYFICNLIWWQINTPVLPTNTSALHFLDIFSTKWFYYNAPLITWIMKFMFSVFGQGNWDLQIIIVNYIFFLIPLYFIYKIGIELKDKETGKIAMILFALTPAVYAMSRQYGHMDYHIIAGITFNIYCLIKTDYFKNIKWTICYGISTGLGLMIKDAFLAYFFAPWLYITIQSLKNNENKSQIINIFLTILVAGLISFWHYGRDLIIKKILYEPIIETVPIFDFQNISKLTTGLWEELLAPPIFVLFIIGLIWFLLKYKNKHKIIVLLWFLIPWGIIILMPHQNLSEYGAGFIPSILLISAIYISSIKKYFVKNLILAFMCIVGLFQFAIFSYIPNSPLTEAKIKFKNKKIHYYKKIFLYSDSDDIKNNMFLVSKLKSDYSKSNISLFCNYDYDICAAQIFLYKNLKAICNVCAIKDFVYIKDYPDCIVFAGKEVTMDDIVSSCMENYDAYAVFQKISRMDFLNTVKNTTKELYQSIQNNFELVEIWYPNNVINENFKVKILRRKNTFK